MHELSLLRSVVDAVEGSLDATAGPVEAVGLVVGSLSGAVPDALQGAWPIAVAGTRLTAARLDIEFVSAAVWCQTCAAEREVDEYFALRCPVCGSPAGDLVKGREFQVAWADLGDTEPVDPHESQPSSTDTA